MGVQGQVKGAGEHFSHLTAVVLTAHSPEELVSSGLPRFMGKPEVFAASRGLYVKTALCCHLPVETATLLSLVRCPVALC